MSTLTLAYHESAAAEANQLSDKLHAAGYSCSKLVCGETSAQLGEALLAAEGHILLLVNDNLLHSLHCQTGLLDSYTQLRERDKLTVVLASTQRQGPGNVQARVLTSLERVSDVIRYMNYWQNAYLVKRRELGATATQQSAEQLAPVRKVSQEIGETLRLMREGKLYSVYDLLDFTAEEYTALLGEPSHPPQEQIQPTGQTEQALDIEPEEDAQTAPSPPEMEETEPAPAAQAAPVSAPEREASVAAAAIEATPEVEATTEPALEAEPETEESTDSSSSAEATATTITSPSEDEPSLRELAAKAQKKSRRKNEKQFYELYENDEQSAAIDFAARAVLEDPEHDKLRYILGIAQLERGESGDRKEAVHQLTQLTESKFAAAASLALGNLALSKRDYGSARRHFKLALKLNPSLDPELHYKLGVLLQEEFPERTKEAAKYLRKAAKRSRDNRGDAYYRLAQLDLSNSNWRNAARNLKTALSFDSEHPFAAYDLALLYLRRERNTKAFKFFEKATVANPELDTVDNRAAFTPPNPELTSNGFDRYINQRTKGSESQAANLSDLVAEREQHELDNQVLTVLITGASSGIGAATARLFAAQGHRLILTGRRVERLRALSSELSRTHDSHIRLLSFDVTQATETRDALETLPTGWREVDVLINNAGKAKGLDSIQAGNLDHWEEMIDTNIKGLLYMTRLISPSMVARNQGHIINVCSTAGHEVYPKGAVYCATKHAVDALTRGMRLDLHSHGIRVSQVSPAHVEETEFAKVRFDGDGERAATVYEDFQPLKASDVARAIYFIATQPPHVNVQDVLMLATQQANSTTIDRSGR